MADGTLLLTVGALLAGGIAVSQVGDRLRVPGLVLVIGLGMLIGSDGLGWLHFDDYELAKSIGIVALAAILFEGGLAAGFPEIRPVLKPALSLALLGTTLTAIFAGLAASWLLHLSLLEGLLLGSILAATDGAAIFAVLRGSPLRLRVARTLEGEAGLNDPVAVLLVIGFSTWITTDGYNLINMAEAFAVELTVGAVAGLVVGGASAALMARKPLTTPGLYPVASMATAALAFGVGDALHGSGFLSVYLAGLALGSLPIAEREAMATFHDGLAWVAQLVMFLTLGLLVFPDALGSVAVQGTVLAILAAVVARPLAVYVATTGLGFDVRERAVLGWAGLRGAVPVVLATFPVLAGVPRAHELFAIAFFAVLLSTVVQGTTFEALARRLDVMGETPERAQRSTRAKDVTSAAGSPANVTASPS
ncbi:MAG TPA: potassium/proton antiporter [Baekduia sp.]|uniref:potassium/proton antiporter n=1 Tax=Baekduia sp. TaxID=2600305 RepID=UPI002D77C3D6|nr:potassium/proton antiporter [Baekduia sp.]HET6506666.1 potassium/proton antiporter [Baekduia sp.]